MDSSELKILVTGCGGDIGQSIGKALKDFEGLAKIYGTDLHLKHAGIFIYAECFIIERASSPNYLNSLTKLVEELEIDVVIPVTEYELELFATRQINEVASARVLRPNDEVIKTGLDKYLTYQALVNNNLPAPSTILPTIGFGGDFPVIVKSRTGSGSKSVALVDDNASLDRALIDIKNPIIQEFVSDTSGEYTCGLFKSRAGEVRLIQLKRELMGGFTGYGEVVDIDAISSLLVKLADKINLVGSINVQLRLDNGVPKVFEINPRFSSTVYFRHLLGFQDVLWCLSDILGLQLSAYNKVQPGVTFYKGFQEYIKK